MQSTLPPPPPPSTPEERPWSGLIIIMVVGVLAIALLGVGLTIFAKDDGTGVTASVRTVPEQVVESDDDIDFGLAFAGRVSHKLGEAADLINDATEDLSAGDIDGAAAKADRAADLYSEMADEARALPGADGDYALVVIGALETCHTANAWSAEVVRERDTEAMQDTSLLDDCTAGLREVSRLTDNMVN